MIDQLFGSKTRVKLLYLFLSNPNRSFFVREITRKVDEQINSVRRELGNLLSIGIITSEKSDNKLYYEVNQKYEHYEALRMLFGKKSTTAKKAIKNVDEKDEDDSLAGRLAKVGTISAAILSRSFTRDMRSPVDLLVVGAVNKTKLKKLVAELEKEEGREIMYSTITEDDFDYRQDINDRFLSDVLSAKKTVIINKDKKIR